MKEKEELRITLPKEPSGGLREAVESSEWAKMQALVYEIAWVPEPITGIKRKMVKVTCTGCGEHVYELHARSASTRGGSYGYHDGRRVVEDGSAAACSCCGAEATAVRAGGIRGYEKAIAAEWPSELRQVEGKACFLGWRAQIMVTRDAGRRITFDPWEGYVVSGGKVARYAGHMRNLGGGECVFGRFEERERYKDEWQGCDVNYVPEGVLTGTEAENSRWDKYCRSGRCYPVSYIKKWTQTPVLEAIVETGGARLVTDAIEGQRHNDCYGYYNVEATPIPGIKRKERRPAAALGMTREEYATALRKNWPMALVRLVARAKKDGLRITEKDADLIMRLGDRYSTEMYEAAPGEFTRTVRYLLRQQEKTKRQELIGWQYYRDYLRMAEGNGEDLDAVRYPRDLIAAHDRERLKREERKDDEHREEFDARAKKLLALAWEKDGLSIRPAMSEAELRAEGSNLWHCVGGYAGKMRRGETAILFIRRAAEPEKSFYTLEFNERGRTVVQNRGAHNCARTPEVEAFEAKWLEHIKDLSRDKDGNWKERKKHERRNDDSAA